MNSQTAAPEFNPVYFVANESMVTSCMLIPVILAVLLLYFPRVNPVTLRVTGFIGIIFGLINVLTWFVLNPGMWWMGVMHLPLLIVSSVGFTAGRSNLKPQRCRLRRQRRAWNLPLPGWIIRM